MAAGVVWTRGHEDGPGAQVAYFVFPLDSLLLLQEEQPTFWWEESPPQQHQSSLQILQTSAKEEKQTKTAFPIFHCLIFPRQINPQPYACSLTAVAMIRDCSRVRRRMNSCWGRTEALADVVS